MSEPTVFRRSREIRERDIDENDHVNNAVWVQFITDVAAAHAASLGWDYETLLATGAIWIVRRHEIDYHRSARLGEEILEETWVESMKGARSIRRARFTRSANDEVLLASRTEWAFVDATTQRPRRIPPEYRTIYLGNDS